MKTNAATNHLPLKELALLAFLSFSAIMHLPPRYYLPASPPSDVTIELNDAQLAELEQAYQEGFDHPDPNGEDPCQQLRLLPYKKLSTWRKQFRKRGFTVQKIKDMLKSGRREIFVHPEKGTRYTKIFDPKGNWIVVDFVDCIVWQVAPHNFK